MNVTLNLAGRKVLLYDNDGILCVSKYAHFALTLVGFRETRDGGARLSPLRIRFPNYASSM